MNKFVARDTAPEIRPSCEKIPEFHWIYIGFSYDAPSSRDSQILLLRSDLANLFSGLESSERFYISYACSKQVAGTFYQTEFDEKNCGSIYIS